jgi:hypothetical protein
MQFCVTSDFFLPPILGSWIYLTSFCNEWFNDVCSTNLRTGSIRDSYWISYTHRFYVTGDFFWFAVLKCI